MVEQGESARHFNDSRQNLIQQRRPDESPEQSLQRETSDGSHQRNQRGRGELCRYDLGYSVLEHL